MVWPAKVPGGSRRPRRNRKTVAPAREKYFSLRSLRGLLVPYTRDEAWIPGPATDKRCPRCWEVKPPNEYSRASHTLDGLQGWCKACMVANRRGWRRGRASFCPVTSAGVLCRTWTRKGGSERANLRQLAELDRPHTPLPVCRAATAAGRCVRSCLSRSPNHFRGGGIGRRRGSLVCRDMVGDECGVIIDEAEQC